jgi:hypothetical protein
MRIVLRDDVALVRRKRQQLVASLEHFPDLEGGRKWPFARHVLVEMADIGRQHDKPATGSDANELQSGGMAACRVNADTGRELGVAITEQDAAA